MAQVPLKILLGKVEVTILLKGRSLPGLAGFAGEEHLQRRCVGRQQGQKSFRFLGGNNPIPEGLV
jgi:hypothetical protein